MSLTTNIVLPYEFFEIFNKYFNLSIRNPDFYPYLERKQILDGLRKLCKKQVLPVNVKFSGEIEQDQYNQLIENYVPNGVVWRFNTLYFPTVNLSSCLINSLVWTNLLIFSIV